MEVLRVFVVWHILQREARLDWIVWQIHQNHIRLESVCLARSPRGAPLGHAGTSAYCLPKRYRRLSMRNRMSREPVGGLGTGESLAHVGVMVQRSADYASP